MKNQRYNLLTTLIVSALHPNEPQAVGTKWEPTNTIHIQEADELCLAGYAEKVAANKDDKVTPTYLQRQDAAKRKAEQDSVEATTEPDDETPAPDSDEALALILEGNVEQVKAELDGLTAEQLYRLDELEGDKDEGGKDRKGVRDAIADAINALEAE